MSANTNAKNVIQQKVLEQVNIGALMQMMNSSEYGQGADKVRFELIEQMQQVVGVMQGIRFIKMIEDLAKQYPGMQKVAVVCTQHDNEEMFDVSQLPNGVYLDTQRLILEEGKKPYVQKIMQVFDPYDEDGLEQYCERNSMLWARKHGYAKDKLQEQEDSEQTVRGQKSKINALIGQAYVMCFGVGNERLDERWMCYPIDMSDPMAVLQKVYDKTLVQYCLSEQQKEQLEQQVQQSPSSKRSKMGL